MFFNRRFGQFGVIVLPLLLIAFLGGVYSALYFAFTLSASLLGHGISMWVTGIPPHLPTHLNTPNFLYITSSMMPFLVLFLMCGTFTGIIIGRKVGQTNITAASLLSYFALFGFLAPLWLIKATWGALRSREASWR